MTSKVSHYSMAASSKEKKAPMEPKPSSSIVLLSPTNQVLLLRRVKTSSSFASAHVFPGGNLSDFHDGAVPPPGNPKRHEDSLTYRLGAIRETFEESGILLARDASRNDGSLLNLPAAERDGARKRIYNNEIKFGEWLESVGGIPDTGMSSAWRLLSFAVHC
jgi:8-oxo-dGTP pyrophosphatase MutT (NUDIX family)